MGAGLFAIAVAQDVLGVVARAVHPAGYYGFGMIVVFWCMLLAGTSY